MVVLPPVEEAKDMALREVEGRRVEEESAVPFGGGGGGRIVEKEEGEDWREGVEEEED